MKQLTILALALAVQYGAWAQSSAKIVETIKGKVVNAVTNEPVSYTNIGLEGTFHGTASDGDGNFELKIPEELVGKSIFFSALGFVSKTFPVKMLFGREFNIVKIEPQSYDIKDVDVAVQSKVLQRILRMASEDIPYNYIAGPYNLQAGYTNEVNVGGTKTVEKADILIYDETGYSKPSQLNAYQSLKYQLNSNAADSTVSFASGITNIDELLGLDWTRLATSVLNPGVLNGFGLQLEAEPTVDGKECWLIAFSQEKPTLAGSGDFYATALDGKILVAKEDYAVLKIEGKVRSPKNNRQGRSLAVANTNQNFLEDVAYTFAVQYKNLKVEQIVLNKSYTRGGKQVNENSKLKINKVFATGLEKVSSRDYFLGM